MNRAELFDKICTDNHEALSDAHGVIRSVDMVRLIRRMNSLTNGMDVDMQIIAVFASLGVGIATATLPEAIALANTDRNAAI